MGNLTGRSGLPLKLILAGQTGQVTVEDHGQLLIEQALWLDHTHHSPVKRPADPEDIKTHCRFGWREVGIVIEGQGHIAFVLSKARGHRHAVEVVIPWWNLVYGSGLIAQHRKRLAKPVIASPKCRIEQYGAFFRADHVEQHPGLTQRRCNQFPAEPQLILCRVIVEPLCQRGRQLAKLPVRPNRR
jgi:hypothetical protein